MVRLFDGSVVRWLDRLLYIWSPTNRQANRCAGEWGPAASGGWSARLGVVTGVSGSAAALEGEMRLPDRPARSPRVSGRREAAVARLARSFSIATRRGRSPL